MFGELGDKKGRKVRFGKDAAGVCSVLMIELE